MDHNIIIKGGTWYCKKRWRSLMSTADGKREVRKQPSFEKPRYRSIIFRGSTHLSLLHPTHFDP
jgi:hypothetical protein